MRKNFVVGLGCAALLCACGSSGKAGGSGKGEPADAGDGGSGSNSSTRQALPCGVVIKDGDCDESQRPLVFVHGTFGSGDNFAHVASLLGSNGFCQDRIVAIEYNSLGGNPVSDGTLDALVDKVLAETGATQVDLAGHSQGTAHCMAYLSDPARAAKVAHYINFSGSGAVPNDVDTLSLSSQHDLNNTPHHATGSHVKTVTFTDQDHFAVAASTQSFVEVYRYLRGEDPKYTEVQCGDDPATVEGISETFGDNAPGTGTIEIREVGDSPRSASAAGMTITVDAVGHFGPVQLKRNVAYEFKGLDAQGSLVGYVYSTPLKRSNRLMRLLTPSSNVLIAGLSTNLVVRGRTHSALIARWAGGAFRQDLGASLKIDGSEVLTSENSGAGALATANLQGGVVGLFLYDANLNRQTDLGLVNSGPFIAFSDVFMDASTAGFIELRFTPGSEEPSTVGSALKISNWPSSDGLILLMFQ